MKKHILLIVLIVANFSNAFTCSCIAVTSFCETTIWNNKVAIVKVINKNEYSFDVEVIDHLTNNIEEEYISINYYLTSCTHFIDVEKGDELIINYNVLNNDNIAPYPTYDFSTCSVNYLKLVDDNKVEGRINGIDYITMPFNMFLNDLEKCLNLETINTNSSFIKRLFLIKKNPVQNQLELRVPYFDEKTAIIIYDIQGRTISTFKNISDKDQSIDINNYSPGLYFCRYIYRGLQVTKKFIKA